MNKLKGKIIGIESSAAMSLVKIGVQEDVFYSVILETPETSAGLKIGQAVTVLFKETEVAIAKNLSGMISLRNRNLSRIRCVIIDKILAKIILDYKGANIVSIITAGSALRMGLKEGDEVEWLVKTNEISLLFGDKHDL